MEQNKWGQTQQGFADIKSQTQGIIKMGRRMALTLYQGFDPLTNQPKGPRLVVNYGSRFWLLRRHSYLFS